MRKSIILLMALLPILVFGQSRGVETFRRSIEYRASDDDSKVSAKNKATIQLQADLLKELGSIVQANYKSTTAINNSSVKLDYEEAVRVATHGNVGVKVISESWDWHIFKLVADLTVDVEAIRAFWENRQKEIEAAEREGRTKETEVKRQAPTPIAGTIIPPGNTLAEQLAYIESQAGKGTVYDIVVNSDVEMKPTTISTMGKDISVIIRSADPKNVRTIQLEAESKGHLLSVDANVTLILQDIILKGHKSNYNALVFVSKGTKLILNSGAKITENTGNGVFVRGGILELNKGAEITKNTTVNFPGGGIYVTDRGTVNIQGGTVSENATTWAEKGRMLDIGGNEMGGGIYVTGNSTINMNEGIISKNQAASCGGGIYISGNSAVTMTGGIISGNRANKHCNYSKDGGVIYLSQYGSSFIGGGGIYVSQSSSFVKKAAEGSDASGVIYGSTGQNANTANFGHAIYRNFGEQKSRNTTLGAYDEISTASNKGWE